MPQILKDFPDQVIQKLLYPFILIPRDIVIVRILKYPPKHERPRYPFNTILSVINFSPRNLSINMIVQLLQQTRLNRKRIVQKFTIEIFLRSLAIYHSHPSVIKLRSTSSTYHL